MGLSEYLEAEGIKHDAIYLTADAPATKEHIVENIESSKVYIIGGLVDRNRHKGLTYRKADELGLRTARLPIEENVTLIGSPSLTTNHGECIIFANRIRSIYLLSISSFLPFSCPYPC